jgi:hypothetical protein
MLRKQQRDLLMCHAPSYPINGNAPVNNPKHQLTPLLLHPPKFSKSVKTHLAECCGAKHTIGMTMRNHRPICTRRMTDSI